MDDDVYSLEQVNLEHQCFMLHTFYSLDNSARNLSYALWLRFLHYSGQVSFSTKIYVHNYELCTFNSWLVVNLSWSSIVFRKNNQTKWSTCHCQSSTISFSGTIVVSKRSRFGLYIMVPWLEPRGLGLFPDCLVIGSKSSLEKILFPRQNIR